MRKKILLTGATGFLGGHLAKALIHDGYDVVALKRKFSSLQRLESILEIINVVDIDDVSLDSLFCNFGKIDAIIHTATCYGRQNESVTEVFNANADFPFRLLEAGSRFGVELFLNTDTALDMNLNMYALSKHQFTQWGKFFSKNKEIRFVNIKLEHFYGPDDKISSFPAYIVNSFIKNIPELDLTQGEQKRDVIYIDDVVAAYLVLIESLSKADKFFIEIDVGSGASVSIRKFVEMAHQIAKSNTKLNFGAIPYRDGELMDSRANTSELISLGWRCRHDLASGLNKMIRLERGKV
jgi:nucleoside-diphosphate-sugar epimerase